jgi:ABC-type cobalamin transport system permease subunit
MTLRSPLRKAILVGVALAIAGAGFSLLFPSAPNYLFLPGMMIIYVVSGGVHGYSTGVYLPSLAVWYTLGGIVNALIYSALAFVVFRRLHRKKAGLL